VQLSWYSLVGCRVAPGLDFLLVHWAETFGSFSSVYRLRSLCLLKILPNFGYRTGLGTPVPVLPHAESDESAEPL